VKEIHHSQKFCLSWQKKVIANKFFSVKFNILSHPQNFKLLGPMFLEHIFMILLLIPGNFKVPTAVPSTKNSEYMNRNFNPVLTRPLQPPVKASTKEEPQPAIDMKFPNAAQAPAQNRIATLNPFETQAKEYLSETIVRLGQCISSSQMQLQILSLQLQHDLPAFVMRAMQLFNDNNQNLLKGSAATPALFYIEQKEFVDQAVSIYLRQLMPSTSTLISEDRSSFCNDPSTFNNQAKSGAPMLLSPSGGASDFMDWMSFQEPTSRFEFDARNENPYAPPSTNLDPESGNTTTALAARKRVCFRNASYVRTPVSPTDIKELELKSNTGNACTFKVPTLHP
jgi:hypothetical protein